jgi:PhnB protein
MNIQPYLFFDTNCAEAMRFYEETLRGKLDLMPFSSMPDFDKHFPPEMADRVLHANLVVGDQVIMASDNGACTAYEGMKGFSVTLTYPEVAEAERVFNAFAEGGEVTMPFAETFWVERFGMVKDRFGTPWSINGGALKV